MDKNYSILKAYGQVGETIAELKNTFKNQLKIGNSTVFDVFRSDIPLYFLIHCIIIISFVQKR